MLWVAIAGLLLVVIGSPLSILRSSSTLEYYRTMLRDGRDDNDAKRVMFGYYAGIAAMVIGAIMIVVSFIMSL